MQAICNRCSSPNALENVQHNNDKDFKPHFTFTWVETDMCPRPGFGMVFLEFRGAMGISRYATRFANETGYSDTVF